MLGLRADRRGNVALITALVLIPLIGFAGLAIDIGTAIAIKRQLDIAADTAALLATTNASNAYAAGAIDPVGQAQSAARQRFKAQAGSRMGVSIGIVNVTVQQSGSVFTSNVTYQAGAPTTLAQVFGVTTIPLSGSASSNLALNPYIDIQILMDVSSSMAIAATQDDINRLQALTAAYVPAVKTPASVHKGEACAFACHWTATGDDYYALAGRSGVQLRIDVLRTAVSNLIQNISALNTHDAYRIGLYSFAQKFTQIYPISDQIAAASSTLAQIAPDVNDCSSNCPDTYFAAGMASLASITPKSGLGGTQSTSQKFLFVITDGLVDQFVGNSREIGPVQISDCAPVKAKGVTILTLYTPYLSLPTNSTFKQRVAPIQSRIGPALQACASSPNLYFEAANSGEIDTQLRRMLSTVLRSSSHLIQ